MKRYLFILALVVGISLFVTSTAFAQDPDPTKPVEIANMFTWATQSPPNWSLGVLFAGLGLVGALVTVFGLIGGAVPGTAGFAAIESGMKRVEEREKTLDKLIKDQPQTSADAIIAIESATNNLRDDLTIERRRQFTIATFLYAILGAFFATLLAQDLLQALVIGAGWTAYLGAIGLKKDYAERKSIKDDSNQELEDALTKVRKQAESKLKDVEAWDDDTFEDFSDLEMNAQVARSI